MCVAYALYAVFIEYYVRIFIRRKFFPPISRPFSLILFVSRLFFSVVLLLDMAPLRPSIDLQPSIFYHYP